MVLELTWGGSGSGTLDSRTHLSGSSTTPSPNRCTAHTDSLVELWDPATSTPDRSTSTTPFCSFLDPSDPPLLSCPQSRDYESESAGSQTEASRSKTNDPSIFWNIPPCGIQDINAALRGRHISGSSTLDDPPEQKRLKMVSDIGIQRDLKPNRCTTSTFLSAQFPDPPASNPDRCTTSTTKSNFLDPNDSPVLTSPQSSDFEKDRAGSSAVEEDFVGIAASSAGRGRAD